MSISYAEICIIQKSQNHVFSRNLRCCGGGYPCGWYCAIGLAAPVVLKILIFEGFLQLLKLAKVRIRYRYLALESSELLRYLVGRGPGEVNQHYTKFRSENEFTTPNKVRVRTRGRI